jgi:hypothetical protein
VGLKRRKGKVKEILIFLHPSLDSALQDIKS